MFLANIYQGTSWSQRTPRFINYDKRYGLISVANGNVATIKQTKYIVIAAIVAAAGLLKSVEKNSSGSWELFFQG